MTATSSQPSDADLRKAWEQCRRSRHTTWPATFEEAMANPLFAGLLRLAVKHPPRPHRPPARATAPAPIPAPRMTRPMFDRKRAAAGEREDD